ncbi:MAG: tyrosine-type recombinase/integrase, partial [Clostridiales Family XIII bacterium]|nr:tyrosine-type recombinase/integrase [Clostridiales Family XIII bacterium]
MIQFEDYLRNEKKLAGNSISAYIKDIKELKSELLNHGVNDLAEATSADIVAYILQLKQSGKSASTVNRKLASIRAYYKYLTGEGIIQVNPAVELKTPRIKRQEVEYLEIAEVDKLLTMPLDSTSGIRDSAIMELFYATGIRATELISADVEDINLRMGFITCDGEFGKARIIPIGRIAKAALEKYIFDEREAIIARNAPHKPAVAHEKALFLNYNGGRITRQSLWKMLKTYGEKAGIEKKISPQILRNSFAVHMLHNGADLKSLQELMGHEDITSTQIYMSATKNRI